MQLAREERALVGFFSALTSWSVRDRFARLHQIALLLDLENVRVHVHILV